MPAIEPASPARLHALDAVRGGALLLGIAFHASMSFLPGPQIWVVRDAPDPLIGGFFFVSHMFRMILFFLIAGFFGRMLVEKKGVRGFAADRGKRIALPLVLFWPLIIAGSLAAFIWGASAMSGGTAPAAPPPPPMTAATFPLTHLWFLYVLLLFYAAALALRGLAALAEPRIGLRNGLDPALRAVSRVGAAPLLLALPAAAILAGKADWIVRAGIPTPDFGLVPNTAALVGYGTAFGFGWLLHRQQDLLAILRRDWPVQLAIAVAATSYLLWALRGAPFFAAEPDGARRMLHAALYMAGAWAWAAAIVGAALRFLSGGRAGIRYVADASYWIYLVHLPVVMALNVAVYPLQAPALAKLALVIAGSFLILFASYHLLVRHSWLGRWLNGRRYSRGRRPELEARPA